MVCSLLWRELEYLYPSCASIPNGGHRDIVKETCLWKRHNLARKHNIKENLTHAAIYLSHMLPEEPENQARKHNIKESLTYAEIYLSHVEGEERKDSPANRSR